MRPLSLRSEPWRVITAAEQQAGPGEVEGNRILGVIVEAEVILRAFGFGNAHFADGGVHAAGCKGGGKRQCKGRCKRRFLTSRSSGDQACAGTIGR